MFSPKINKCGDRCVNELDWRNLSRCIHISKRHYVQFKYFKVLSIIP